MSTNLSLKQAQRKLGSAPGLFAKPIIRALEEWIQAVDDLRGHAQYSCPEAARQLVQAALQQQPRNQEEQTTRNKQQSDQLYLPWVAKHLPGISAAMQECVSRQLNISNKRISILQSLVKTSQQHDRSQLQLRIDAESRAYLLVEMQCWVLSVILPVAAVCKFAARPGRSNDFSAPAHHVSGRRLGDNAILMMAEDLQLAQDTRRQQRRQVSQARQCLFELGVPSDQGSPRHMASYLNILTMITDVNMLWLHMAAQLLPHCSWAVYFIQVSIVGPAVGLSPKCAHKSYDLARADLFRLLAYPGLFLELETACGRKFLGRVLQDLVVTAEQLQAAGVPALIQKELLSMMEDAAADDALHEHQLHGHQPATSGDSVTHSNQQGVDGSMGSSGTDDAVTAVGAAADDKGGSEEDTMHALLEMMYGSMI